MTWESSEVKESLHNGRHELVAAGGARAGHIANVLSKSHKRRDGTSTRPGTSARTSAGDAPGRASRSPRAAEHRQLDSRGLLPRWAATAYGAALTVINASRAALLTSSCGRGDRWCVDELPQQRTIETKCWLISSCVSACAVRCAPVQKKNWHVGLRRQANNFTKHRLFNAKTFK